MELCTALNDTRHTCKDQIGGCDNKVKGSDNPTGGFEGKVKGKKGVIRELVHVMDFYHPEIKALMTLILCKIDRFSFVVFMR